MYRPIALFNKNSFASKTSANPSVLASMACLAAIALAVSPICSARGDDTKAANKSNTSTGSASVPETSGQQAGNEIQERTAGHDSLPSHAALGVLLDQSADAVKVSEVIAGSPAERAGLIVGDEIRFIGDLRIFKVQDLTDEIGTNSPGAKVELTIRRNGRRQIVEATLAAWDETFPDRKFAKDSVSYKSYSYGPSTGPDRATLQLERKRMRALEQQIYRLQQQINAMQQSRQANQFDADQDWWERVRHGETNNDPALFQ